MRVRSETVNKPQSLRHALNKAVPYVRNNPDKLHLFVDNGSLVATGASSMSWEYRYTLNAVIEDFSGDQNLLMAPVLLWLRDNQPDAINNLETAFALPAVYSNQFAPPSTSADACVTEHPDGGWFEYEPATGRWYVRGIKSMVIEAADNITMKTSEFVLEADRTRINSEVVINGGVTQGGGAMSSNGIVVDAHQHTGVLKGGDTTGGPV
ncbi:phage baseplate assembly protein V [Escherichia coli]|nr:phage baseplate assembly protein V [Escherichia coli]MBI0967482.1 phage baseplate assembly protein V [Escherichia coli]